MADPRGACEALEQAGWLSENLVSHSPQPDFFKPVLTPLLRREDKLPRHWSLRSKRSSSSAKGSPASSRHGSADLQASTQAHSGAGWAQAAWQHLSPVHAAGTAAGGYQTRDQLPSAGQASQGGPCRCCCLHLPDLRPLLSHAAHVCAAIRRCTAAAPALHHPQHRAGRRTGAQQQPHRFHRQGSLQQGRFSRAQQPQFAGHRSGRCICSAGGRGQRRQAGVQPCHSMD